jgi:hypothetical protein
MYLLFYHKYVKHNLYSYVLLLITIVPLLRKPCWFIRFFVQRVTAIPNIPRNIQPPGARNSSYTANINRQVLITDRQNISTQQVKRCDLRFTRLIIPFVMPTNCHKSRRHLALYLVLTGKIKQATVIFEVYHGYQIQTKRYAHLLRSCYFAG